MSEHSSRPLVKKLGIKPDHVVLLVNEPAEFRSLLIDLPAGVTLTDDANKANVIIFFITACNELKRFARLQKKLIVGGGLWVAYPKKTSGVETDVTFDPVQTTGLQSGLVDNKICALNAIWTALRFVYRKS
jgi:hypothetical protein